MWLFGILFLLSGSCTVVRWVEYYDADEAHGAYLSKLYDATVERDLGEQKRIHEDEYAPEAEKPWEITLATSVITILFGTSVIVSLKN